MVLLRIRRGSRPHRSAHIVYRSHKWLEAAQSPACQAGADGPLRLPRSCFGRWSRIAHSTTVLRVLQLPVLGETSSGVPCPVVTGRGGERAARERGVLPTGVYPALGTHTTSKSARRHIVKIALFEGYVWGTGRVSEKMLLVGPRALSISSTTTPRAAALGHSAADARHC